MNSSKPPLKFLAVLNILAFTCMIIANGLANGLPLNGKTTGEVSDLYPNYFTPAGVTFSIWGVIYLFLLGFVVYQAIICFQGKQPQLKTIRSISPYFIANCLLNAAWIFAWHYLHVTTSLLIIIGILTSLILIHEKAGLPYNWHKGKDKWLVDIPFSLYFGWITIATIANATAFLVAKGWNGGSIPEWRWAAIMIVAGTLICLWVLLKKRNVVYSLVVIWAFVGIVLQRNAAGTSADQHIIVVAKVCMGLIFTIILFTWLRSSKLKMPGK